MFASDHVRHFIVNDEAEVTKPRLVNDHGFYVYEVDVSARMVTVPGGLELSARQLVELDDDELPEGVKVEDVMPSRKPAVSLAALAEANNTTLEALVEKYSGQLHQAWPATVPGILLAMLNELEGK